MDATQQFLQQEKLHVPEKFVISGESKVSQFIEK
jgi:glutathione synthase/RimK-type ligase-like ATP-grasp enzyme